MWLLFFLKSFVIVIFFKSFVIVIFFKCPFEIEVISFCKLLAFSLEFNFFFLVTKTFFFLTVGLNNFRNKIPILIYSFLSVNQRKSPCPPSWRTYQQTHLGSRVRHIRQSSYGLWNLSKRSSWTLRHPYWRHWKSGCSKRCRK